MSATVQSVARRATTLDLTPDGTWASRYRMAWRDVADAMALWRLCCTLSWLDIKLRYRGSMLGPFWLTLSTAIMVAAMGGIYATLFRMDLHEYLPFLALSLVLWGFVSAVVSEGCTGYTIAESMIRSVRMPFTVYAVRIIIRNLLVLAHNLVVIVAVFAVFDTWPGAEALLALPAVAMWLIDGLAFTLMIGALCARFRDIPPIVGSVLQMAFFITPVIWKPQLVGADKAWLLPFNPFYALLETLRGPLMGRTPDTAVYVSALLYSLALCGLTWVFFARVRGRIAFWV